MSFSDIMSLTSLGKIHNEFDVNISLEEFKDIVSNRHQQTSSPLINSKIRLDGSGLYRHEIDCGMCIGYGHGSYDYCVGWFA